MTKHDLITGTAWGIGIGLVALLGTNDPLAMGAAGFGIVFGICHREAKRFRVRPVFAGIFGLLAGWMAMGYLHVDAEGAAVMMALLFVVFSGVAFQIGKGVLSK